MTTEYPDVLGDLVEARRRSEVNGVHYVMALEPTTLAPGQAADLRLWLQSCWDVPLHVGVTILLPTQPPPAFSIIQKVTEVPLEPAEVGEVTIPIACLPDALSKEYVLTVRVGAKPETRGLFVRSMENKGRLGETLLSFTTGMGLAQTVSLGFAAHTQPERKYTMRVVGPPQSGPSPNLVPTYLSHWTVDDLPLQGKARQLVNDQRLYLLPKVNREALYMAFLDESRARLKDAGLTLQIGEAIFLAKILTYCCEYFLQHPEWQDGILVPAYTLAFRYNLTTRDPVSLIVRGDYARQARLAMSLSFGLLKQHLKRDPWSMEEQLAVTDLVADRVEHGGVLPAEFLYLPLLLGGLLVAGDVQMPGENLSQSLDLLTKARQQREPELADNPELLALFDRLLQGARAVV